MATSAIDAFEVNVHCAMADPNEPRYQYSTSNNTRNANRRAAEPQEARGRGRRPPTARKRGLDPIAEPSQAKPPEKKKRTITQFKSAIPPTDPLYYLDAPGPAPKSANASPAISRSTSRGTQGSASAPPPDSDEEMSDVLPQSTGFAGPSRFTTAIGPETDLTQGLPEHQVVNMFGMPLLTSQLDEGDEDLSEAARNVRCLMSVIDVILIQSID